MNLFSFGCSNTVGVGLADVFPSLDRPSEYSWAAELARRLECKLINKAEGGSSNLLILNNILETSFDKDDIAVVMWSYPDRDTIFYENSRRSLGTWSVHTKGISEYAKSWIADTTSYSNNIKTWMYIYHAHLHLTQLGIKFRFINIQQDDDLFVERPQYSRNIKFINQDTMGRWKTLPLALDNIHPGQEWHKRCADVVYGDLNE